MKYLLLIVLYLLMASSAFAVADPDPDGIGIYFDLTADINYVVAAQYDQVVTYLIITNPTAPSVGGWECTIDFDMDSYMVLGSWILAGNAKNVFEEPEFAVDLVEPLPVEPATLLLTFNLFDMDPVPTWFIVGPSPMPSTPDELPLYVNGDDPSQFIVLRNVTGYNVNGDIMPCAGINWIVHALTNTTWSAIKKLWND